MVGPVAVNLHLDVAAVRSWAQYTEAWLGDRRAELDELNVFPVPDSDTGTNLYLTFADARSAVAALSDGSPLPAAGAALVRGALVGARGNSGVIVGEYVGELVRGLLAEATDADAVVTPARLVTALGDAAAAAYRAVGEAVEGTVLTVARVVGEAARSAVVEPGAPVGALAALDAGITEGYVALGRTTAQLAPLRAAGVLDAGAWGLLLVLDALATALGSAQAASRAAGHPTPAPDDGASGHGTTDQCEQGDGPDVPAGQLAHGGGEFEVMYLVEAPGHDVVPVLGADEVAPALRDALSRVGESVAVVGGAGLWQAHVHTDRPLDAIAVPSTIGAQPDQIRTRHLANQVGVHGNHRPDLGLVAVTAAPGLVADLARAGAVVVLVPPHGAVGPELARAVEDTGAERVVVLAVAPVGVPQRPGVAVLDHLDEVQVVSGAATLVSLEPGSTPDDLIEDVRRAVTGVRTLAVPSVGAVGDSGSPGRGDDGADLVTAATALLGGGGGLVTVITGSGTEVEEVAELRQVLGRTHPSVEVLVLDGGKPGRASVVGVE